MKEEHTQSPENINVWAGIIGDHFIGSFFFDGNLTDYEYLAVLQNNVKPTLLNLYPHPPVPNNRPFFQQDGGPLHYQINVRQYFNRIFPNR